MGTKIRCCRIEEAFSAEGTWDLCLISAAGKSELQPGFFLFQDINR